MSDRLFVEFEEKPKACSAVYVSEDKIDALARYFASSCDEAAVVRTPDGIELRLTYKGTTITAMPGHVLLYGQPPIVVDGAEFRRQWRQAT